MNTSLKTWRNKSFNFLTLVSFGVGQDIQIFGRQRKVWRYKWGIQVSRSRKSIDRQNHCQKKKGQTTVYKIWATQTPLKTGGNSMCPGRVSSSCSTSDTHHVTLFTSDKSIMNEERTKWWLWQVEHLLLFKKAVFKRCAITCISLCFSKDV